MTELKFYFVEEGKSIPVKAVRLDQAFINERVPNVFGFLIRKEKDRSRKPDKSLWNGLRPSLLRLGLTYPKIDEHAWFTYELKSDGKVKRVPLAEYLSRKGGK